MIDFGGWHWFFSGKEDALVKEKCGKWMYHFTDEAFAMKICQKAIDENVCLECKCSDMTVSASKEGVVCFYQNSDNMDNHRKIIKFMLDNKLIRKTKSGRFYNEGFKLDSQTRAGEYGDDFEATIKLEQFIDLNTGNFISERAFIKSNDNDYEIAVIDTETTYSDKVMSIGVVIASSKTFLSTKSLYFVIQPECEEPSLYGDRIDYVNQENVNAYECDIKEAISIIRKELKEHNVSSIYAYNAGFDKRHLPQLELFTWFDIMKIAANKNYNRKLPDNLEYCSTGRLKSRYDVGSIISYISGDEYYYEKHNAISDALDELSIMRLLGLPIEKYAPANISKKIENTKLTSHSNNSNNIVVHKSNKSSPEIQSITRTTRTRTTSGLFGVDETYTSSETKITYTEGGVKKTATFYNLSAQDEKNIIESFGKTQNNKQVDHIKECYTITEAADLLGFTESQTIKKVRDLGIKIYDENGLRKVSKVAIDKYLEEKRKEFKNGMILLGILLGISVVFVLVLALGR